MWLSLSFVPLLLSAYLSKNLSSSLSLHTKSLAHREEELYINNNNMRGFLPDQLFNLTNLRVLDASYNRFRGTISPSIERLTELEELRLHGNRFRGAIPTELAALENMAEITLHFNRFSGTVPQEMCELYRDPFQLELFAADCASFGRPDAAGRTAPAVECTCCTDCCIADEEICMSVHGLLQGDGV